MSRNQGFEYRERIRAHTPSRTVLGHLAERYPHSSRDQWRQRISRGLVQVDGRQATADQPLAAGQLLVWHRPPWDEPAAPVRFTMLYRDHHLLAVAKPAGLPTLPGAGYVERTLLHQVRLREPQATPMHRLGRWTSGIVIFARTPEARRHLAGVWRQREVYKRYRTLASGHAVQRTFRIDTPIGPVPYRRLGHLHAASSTGRPAASEVTVLEQRRDAFLADVVIETGRPHQVRIHLAAAGHPLVGDPLYQIGGLPDPTGRARPGDPGYRLAAVEVRLAHPATGRPWRLTWAPPADLRARNATHGTKCPRPNLTS